MVDRSNRKEVRRLRDRVIYLQNRRYYIIEHQSELHNPRNDCQLFSISEEIVRLSKEETKIQEEIKEMLWES